MALERRFPLRPSRTRELEAGDFWAVELEDGTYGCVQVTELNRQGVGSRTTLLVGIMAWRGADAPTADRVDGAIVVEQGLTHLKVFTHAGAVVLGNVEPRFDVKLDSNYRDHHVGAVHHVYGWRALPTIVERVLREAQVVDPV